MKSRWSWVGAVRVEVQRSMGILAGAAAAFVAVGAGAVHAAPPLGAGLNGISDWSRTNEFADLVKQSRRFGSPNAPWDESAPVDARGWPTADAGVVLMCCQPDSPDLGGIYRIRFECAITPLIQPVASPGIVRNIQRDAATGIVTAEYVQPAGRDQIMLAFRNTTPAGGGPGGIRNLTVMRPGTADGQILTPAFLDHNRRFAAVRFMDWTDTNNNETVSWDQRTRPEDATWRWRSGVPYEICAEVCNQINRDMWINVPAKANDDYVRQMARLIRDRLNPNLNVYVEYSNEVWNWSFSQGTWNWQQAVAEAAAGNSNLNYDGATDHNVLRWRRHARETVRVGRIFAEEFGSGSLNTRVRPILAGQIVWTDQYREMLKFINDIFGPPRDHVYAMSGAPYFNLGDADTRTNLTTTEVLDALSASIDSTNASLMYEQLAAYTAMWRLRPFTGYEGGPDTFGPNNIAAKRAASYDPRMRELSARYLNGWYAAGFGLFNWFVSGAGDWDTQYGTWTLTETMADQATPKILAIDDVRAAPTPAITAGTPAPGILDARKHTHRGTNWQTQPDSGFRGAGDSLTYLIRAEPPNGQPFARYALRIRAATWDAVTTANASINRGPNITITLPPSTGNWGNSNHTWSTSSKPFTLTTGLSALSIAWVTGYSFTMRDIELRALCTADFNADSTADFFDYLDFVQAFADKRPEADINGDGSIDFFDYLDFVQAFAAGC
jgi:hypothetical protein